MKKPEKKEINCFSKCAMGISGCNCNVKPKIYNQACEVWEKYHNYILSNKLDVKVIQQLIWDYFQGTQLKELLNGRIDCLDMAKAISKRLGE